MCNHMCDNKPRHLDLYCCLALSFYTRILVFLLDFKACFACLCRDPELAATCIANAVSAFTHGSRLFEASNDPLNLAVTFCNLAHMCKLNASLPPDNRQSNHGSARHLTVSGCLVRVKVFW